MKTIGTLNSGTEVQRRTEMTDAELEMAFLAAMGEAENAAGVLIEKFATAALRIVDLHRREAWARITDGEGNQVWSSPVAYYSHLASAEKFPKIHKTMREEIVTELFAITANETGDIGMPIGVNELAALLNTDKSQVSLTAKAEKTKREEAAKQAEAEELAEAKAEALATVKAETHAEALAEAEAEGLTPEQSEAKAEQAVALVEKLAQREDEAERKQAEAKAEASKRAAERKQAEGRVKRAKGALEQALKTASELRAEMTEADQAWFLTLVNCAVANWSPQAEGEQAEGEQAEGEQAEGEQAEAQLIGVPVDPTHKVATPAEAAARRGRGRGKQAATA